MRIFEDWRNSDEGSEANNNLNNNEIIEIQEEENKLNWPLIFTLPEWIKTEQVVIVQRDQRQFAKYYFARSFICQNFLWKYVS